VSVFNKEKENKMLFQGWDLLFTLDEYGDGGEEVASYVILEFVFYVVME
jgi:hypothetical protein